jgi:heptosyltransferase-2/heptosyltransferase-3
VRFGAFGDMVLLTALIRELHAEFRVPVDVLTSGSWSVPLLAGQPGVGNVYSLRSRKTPYWLAPDQRRVVGALRARGLSATWLCDDDDAARRLLRRAGIAPDWIVDVADHPRLPEEHATTQWRRLARILPRALAGAALPGAPTADVGCDLRVSDRERADLEAWLGARAIAAGPILLVQMGNKRTMRRGTRRLAANHKYWPPERWRSVIEHMRARHPRHAILLLGTGPEYALNQALIEQAGVPDLYNVADDLPVPRLVALLARAAGLLTVDSGPAHAAAAVACPQVVLFGRALPSLYRPWGSAGAPVIVLTGTQGGEPSMQGITAAEVIAAWERLSLRGRPG